MKNIFYIISIALLLSSCSEVKQENRIAENNELVEFAKVNCMFWYFKKKGYSIEDIGAISGGIVELGSYSAEKYSKVAFLVKEYKPNIQTKNKIDIDLLKCFQMEKDSDFLLKIEKLK